MAAGQLDGRGVIVGCTSCGQQNRLPFAALAKSIRCASCKAALGSPATPVDATDSTAFRAAMADSAIPVIVDFWAPWCGPCRMVAPELERLARDSQGQFLIVKVNTDVLTDVAAEFRIRSIPTLAVVWHGRELGRVAGARSAAEIRGFAEQSVSEAGRRAS